MDSESMIALSAATTSLAAAGALSAARGAGAKRARIYLIVVFALFAGIVAIPIVVAFARSLYVFYMPAVLPMLLTLPPAVYHYVAARTAPNTPPRIHRRDIVLPVLGVMLTFGYWLLPTASKNAMFVDGVAPPGLAVAALALSTFTLIFFWAIASSIYLAATIRRLYAFRTRLKDLYSNTDKRELRWIDWFMGFLIVLWGAAAVSLVSDNFGPGLVFSGEIVFAIAAALLLLLIAFASIAPSTETPETIAATADAEAAPTEKYARSALSDDFAQTLAQRIETAMRKDALYLDPNLSLQKLSRHVGAAPNMTSQTLNEHIGSTFFDYVARWRVEAAKPRIISSEASVLTIALEVGFNSRSTFYKAFKRETGMTPKAFREKHAAGNTTT